MVLYEPVDVVMTAEQQQQVNAFFQLINNAQQNNLFLQLRIRRQCEQSTLTQPGNKGIIK